MQRAWGPAMSTPKMTITLKEIQSTADTQTYRLQTVGAPKGMHYSLVTWPVTSNAPQTVAEGVSLNADGIAICAGKTASDCGSSDKPDDPIDLEMHAAPGEPVRMALISTDSSVKLFTKTVPVPLEGKDRGCRVEAILLTAGAEAVMLEADGFAPNSELTILSLSGTETRTDKKSADANGHYSMVDLPYVEGVDHGSVSVTIKSAKCSPSVTVNWGKPS
jgi:hypothetical protein